MPKVRHHFFTAMVVLSSNEKSYLLYFLVYIAIEYPWLKYLWGGI